MAPPVPGPSCMDAALTSLGRVGGGLRRLVVRGSGGDGIVVDTNPRRNPGGSCPRSFAAAGRATSAVTRAPRGTGRGGRAGHCVPETPAVRSAATRNHGVPWQLWHLMRALLPGTMRGRAGAVEGRIEGRGSVGGARAPGARAEPGRRHYPKIKLR